MTRTRWTQSMWLGLLAFGAGCLGDDLNVTPDPALVVNVAAMSLAGVGDVVWDVEVLNGAGDVVWQRRLASSRFGDGAGSASFVGPCDAALDVAENTVSLWVVGLYTAAVTDAGAFAGGAASGEGAVAGAPIDFESPTASGPLSRTVTCRPNEDAVAQFDVALMRPAQQGFFDVAVSFDDVFCSAKFDCCTEDEAGSACASDIYLLFDELGERGPTMILGFACVAEARAEVETLLYLDGLTLDCTSPTAPFVADVTLNPAGPPGNQCAVGPDGMSSCVGVVTEASGVDADTWLYQVGVYRGVEALQHGGGDAQLVYWNVALGVKRPEIASCVLRTRGTVDDVSATELVDGGTIAGGTVYPFVKWEVDLGACMEEPLSLGDPAAMVRPEYTGTAGDGLGFAYGFGPNMPAASFCGSACESPPGECWMPLGACGLFGMCEYTPRTAGAACGDDGNVCTVDTCDGGGECVHPPGNAGVECRAVAGVCDVAEACDGSAAACPGDAKVAEGAICREALDACDGAESCDGTSSACPAPGVSACGSCGPADGGSTVGAPVADLCAVGDASAVSGSGPYGWSCSGVGGGAGVSCSSNRGCEATTLSWGSCSADWDAQAHGFSGAVVNGAGGYTGGATATCDQGAWSVSDASCVEVIEAACGAADGGSTTSAPSASLCASGTASAVSGSGPYSWTCSGQGGGSDDSCSSNRSCTSTTLAWGSCSASRTAQAHGFSGAVSNTTSGYTGGATSTCSQGTWSTSSTSCTQIINASCGSADGGSTTSAPSASLCASGTASAVSGSGPYSWTCSGQGGGSNDSCSSDRSCTSTTLAWGSCSASRTAQAHGFSGSVSNTTSGYTGGATSTCSQGTWSTSSTSCTQIINASCGSADGGSTTSAPSASLCASGTASGVSGSGPYTWTCSGQGGGSNDSCTSYKTCSAQTLSWGSCDDTTAARTRGQTLSLTNHTSGYIGTATATCSSSGNGTWTLSNTSCTQIINASCGSHDNTNQTAAPSTTAHKCAAGSPSAISGSGPWTWSCSGQGGGSNDSCVSYKICPAQTLSWSNCDDTTAARTRGQTYALTNHTSGYNGSGTATCNSSGNGTWSLSNTSCSLAQVCTPGSWTSCGFGTCHCGHLQKQCNAAGTGWGSCVNGPGSGCQSPGTDCF